MLKGEINMKNLNKLKSSYRFIGYDPKINEWIIKRHKRPLEKIGCISIQKFNIYEEMDDELNNKVTYALMYKYSNVLE
jgi:hypothetical protein